MSYLPFSHEGPTLTFQLWALGWDQNRHWTEYFDEVQKRCISLAFVMVSWSSTIRIEWLDILTQV